MSLSTIFNKETSLIKEFNIRYGLNFLVYLIVFSMLLLKRVKYSVFIFILLISLQTIAYFYTPLYLTYQLQNTVTYGIPPHVVWFNENYDRGLILISAQKHDPEMIQMKLPYKTFIHEGTQRYWIDSRNNPQKYARWIILNTWEKDDQVTKFWKDSPALDSFYDRVYDNNGVLIYKIKAETNAIIDNRV